MKKRIVSLLLCVSLLLGVAPAVFAEEEAACICETACIAEEKKADCPVCGAEGATVESCGKHEPVTPTAEKQEETPVEAPKPEEPAEEPKQEETPADVPNPEVPTEEPKTEEPQPTLTAVEQVQAMIDALPEAETITAENRAAVEAQLTAIDEARLLLCDEEQAQLNFEGYNAAVAALNILDDMAGAEIPETLEDIMVYTADDLVNAVKNDGSYKLGADIQLTDTLQIDKNVTILLYGHVLEGSISIGSSVRVWLSDGNENTQHDGIYANYRGGILTGGITVNGQFEMFGGTILGNINSENADSFRFTRGMFYGTVDANHSTAFSISFKIGDTTYATEGLGEGEPSYAPVPPTATGKTFLGWYSKSGEGYTPFSFGSDIDESITLYAIWEGDFEVEVRDIYGTIYYKTLSSAFSGVREESPQFVLLKDVNIGTAPIKYDKRNVTLDLKGRTLTGDIQVKKNTNEGLEYMLTLQDSGDTKGSFGGTITVDGGYALLIAKGVKITKAVLQNGGTLKCEGAVITTLVNNGGTVNHIFGTDNKCACGAVRYTITLDPGEGKLPEATASTTYTDTDGKLTTLPTPEREGCAFTGWYTEGGDKVTGETKFSADAKIYARWVELVKKLSFTMTGYGYGNDVGKLTVTPDKDNKGVSKVAVAVGTSKMGFQPYTGKFDKETTYYLQLTLTQQEGFSCAGMTKDAVTLNGWKANEGEMNGDGTAYIAWFKLPIIYAVKLECGRNGTITYGDTVYKDEQTATVYLLEGEDASFTMAPNSGYTYSRLYIDGKKQTKALKTYTFEDIDSSHALKAVFSKTSDNPKTGDGVILPAAVMILSAMAIPAIVLRRKRR